MSKLKYYIFTVLEWFFITAMIILLIILSVVSIPLLVLLGVLFWIVNYFENLKTKGCEK